MVRLAWLLSCIVLLAGACTRPGPEPTRTPLPTRQTTIAPVNEKLDTASQDTERRRQDIDNAAK